MINNNIKNNYLPNIQDTNNLSALDINKIIVSEVLKQKSIEEINNKNSNDIKDNILKIDDYKQIKKIKTDITLCEFHKTKLNNKCKKCQNNKIDFQKYAMDNINTITKHLEIKSDNIDNNNTIKKNLDDIKQENLTLINPTNINNQISNNSNNYINTITTKYEFIPVTDKKNYNLNDLLYNNIILSSYYKELYTNKTTFEDICNEISENANSVEPWNNVQLKIPSTLFCCLYRMMQFNLNKIQIKFLLNNGEITDEMRNPNTFCLLNFKNNEVINLFNINNNFKTSVTPNIFLKATGYLYLRYLANPIDLLSWFENDLSNIGKYALFGKKNKSLYYNYNRNLDYEAEDSVDEEVEIGEFLTKLLKDNEYYGTRFPKLPLLIDKQIKEKLNEYNSYRFRKRSNINNLNYIKKGLSVLVKVGYENSKEKWEDGNVLFVNEDDIDIKINVRLKSSNEGNKFNYNFIINIK